MLKPGAKDLEIVAKDPLLAGADGLAFGEKTILYVNSFTTSKLLRVDLGTDGKSKKVTELKLPRPLDRPDGMRAILKTIKEGLDSTPGVTATRGMAWIVEGKLGYMMDPAFKGKDPGTFRLVAVPLPKN
jgi:hypothetical protein